MPNPSRLRAAALTATVVLLSATLAGCGGDSKDEDPTAQKLSWKDCPAPSESEGGVPRRRRCRTAPSGSAPP